MLAANLYLMYVFPKTKCDSSSSFANVITVSHRSEVLELHVESCFVSCLYACVRLCKNCVSGMPSLKFLKLCVS